MCRCGWLSLAERGLSVTERGSLSARMSARLEPHHLEREAGPSLAELGAAWHGRLKVEQGERLWVPREALVGASEEAAKSHREFLSVLQVSHNAGFWKFSLRRGGALCSALRLNPPPHRAHSSAGPGSVVRPGRARWPAPLVLCCRHSSKVLRFAGWSFQCPGHNPPQFWLPKKCCCETGWLLGSVRSRW